MYIDGVRYIRNGTLKIPLPADCRKRSARWAFVMGAIGVALAIAEILSVGTGLSLEDHVKFSGMTVLYLGLGGMLARDAIRGYVTTASYRQA